MALDPNIALAVRVAPFETRIQSPVDRYARMLSLRQLMQQQETSQALEEERKQKAQLAREEQERQSQFRALWKPGQPEPTEAQAYGILGQTGGAAYAKTRREQETAQQATEQARIKNEQARDAMLGQIAGGVLNANTQEGFERGIMDAGARDLIGQDELHQLIGLRWDDPQTKAQVAQIARRGSEVEKQQAMDINAAKEGREVAEHPAKLAETKAKSLGEQLKAAAQSVPDNQTDWDTWRASLSPELQSRVAAMYSPTNRQMVEQFGLTAAERATGQRAVGTATETERHHREVERLTGRRISAAGGGAGGASANDEALADTVIDNPALWNTLTPTAKTRISPLLAKKGFTEFGKPLNESAMSKIAESRAAIKSLQDLRTTLQENEDYIGPIAGLQALYPYSDARKAQAKIDLVRQRVGKALEGGVLRKEDEEKYKKILATLRDEPATAISKIDNLLTTFERDIQIFEEEQRRGGRNVPPREPEKKTGAASGAPAVGTVKGGYEFTGGDPADKKNWRKTT